MLLWITVALWILTMIALAHVAILNATPTWYIRRTRSALNGDAVGNGDQPWYVTYASRLP